MLVLLCAVAAAATGYFVSTVTNGAPPDRAAMHSEVIAAFHHLVGPPDTRGSLADYVQGIDPALSRMLNEGAFNPVSDVAGVLTNSIMRVQSIRQTSTSAVTVDFTLGPRFQTQPPQAYVGTAVLDSGRWRVSWVTVCMLIEQEEVNCPSPPAGLATPLPLPYRVDPAKSADSPDLVHPGALALSAQGNLYIADSARDQILEWHPGGLLTVFAGTGESGFSGDGGPAADAQLSGLGDLAVTLAGTLYFIDGSRVRAVSPGGIIRTVAGDGVNGPSQSPSIGDGGPAVKAPLNPSGIAVSRDGTLYIATGDTIRKVSPDGTISTFFAGSETGWVVTPAGRFGFAPSDIAFDGAGNLDVFNGGGPRNLLQIPPSGKSITSLGFAYVAQLTTAPDGEVYGAGHAESVVRVTAAGETLFRDLLGLKINGLWRPGVLPGLEPSGIAVAPSGVIYLDSFAGNGWTGGTSLAELTPAGQLNALPIHTAVDATLPGIGAPHFPASAYPVPRRAQGSALSACPAEAGLRRFDPAAESAALAKVHKITGFGTTFYDDLEASDRSWWPALLTQWNGEGDAGAGVMSSGPASADPYAGAVAAACGEALVQDSFVVDIGSSPYTSTFGHLFLLDRGGVPLIYFQAP